jgi:hypothetical protein
VWRPFRSHQERVLKEEKMVMACRSCGSEKQTEFGAEMLIHFPGRKGLDKPCCLGIPEACGLLRLRSYFV